MFTLCKCWWRSLVALIVEVPLDGIFQGRGTDVAQSRRRMDWARFEWFQGNVM